MLRRPISFLLVFSVSFLLSCDTEQNILGVGSRLGLGCNYYDVIPPEQIETLDEVTIAAVTRSPEYTWTESVDFCGVVGYQFAIGTTPGGEELVPYKDIGLVLTYRELGLTLDSSAFYYTSIRAVDAKNNYGEPIISDPWQQLDPVRDLPNLILRLDANSLTSIRDESNDPAGSGGFSGNVDRWNDTSTGGASHNFFAKTATYMPTFNPSGWLDFNGIDQALTVPDHVELNIGTVAQRNFTAVFETGADINTKQVIYDEGGNVRGMNYYISGGRFYCGFYNLIEDGDGIQPFTYVSTPISANTRYIATWVFDYTNYTGPTGPDGSLNCFVNDVSIGTTTSTSKLFAHSGDIGLGGFINTTYFHDVGAITGDGGYFNGKIFEFMIVNGAPAPGDVSTIYQYLSDKWSVP